MSSCKHEDALRQAAVVDHWEDCPAADWCYDDEDKTEEQGDEERAEACVCSLVIAARGAAQATCEGRRAAVQEIVEHFGGSPDCRCGYLAALYDSLEDEGEGPYWDRARGCMCYGGPLVIALKEGCTCGEGGKP